MFKRKDGKYLLYIPVDLAEDSMFPFREWKKTKRGTDAIPVKVRFDSSNRTAQLIVEKWQ